MRKFKDAEGREYAIDLKWKQVRAMEAAGFDFTRLSEGVRLSAAVDALLIVTEGQRKRMGVDEDSFASAIVPELQGAVEALAAEVTAFFRLTTPADSPGAES